MKRRSTLIVFLAVGIHLHSFAFSLIHAQEQPESIIGRIEKSGAKLYELARDELEKGKEAYLHLRAEFMVEELRLRQGSERPTAEEEELSQKFHDMRSSFVSKFQGAQMDQETNFPCAMPFPLVKHQIKELESFALIQRMPKGGNLHVHSSASGTAQWIAKHAGDFKNCYIYWPTEEAKTNGYIQGELRFFDAGKNPAGFQLASQLRDSNPEFVEQFISLVEIDASDFRGTDSNPWSQFNRTFRITGSFVSQQPVFQAYYEAALRGMIADGISYVEMRTGIVGLADHNRPDKNWAEQDFVEEYLAIRDRIREDHPNFDLKLIITAGRNDPPARVFDKLAEVAELHAAYPDFVIGFDLVGRESMINQSRNFLDVWMKAKTTMMDPRRGLPFYFHDGETDWADNEDVVDAMLLGARRIGHGFNLVAYPAVESRLRRLGIALEVCPISNQMLRYVRDMRLHPAAGYFRRGVPCVLASDDPLIFGNEGLSYDFWSAWMAWKLDLLDLKILARNSILFSGMQPEQKADALRQFSDDWQTFVARELR